MNFVQRQHDHNVPQGRLTQTFSDGSGRSLAVVEFDLGSAHVAANTITVSRSDYIRLENTVTRLQALVKSQKLTIDDLTAQLASVKSLTTVQINEDTWTEVNDRRCELIEKDINETISEQEKLELAALERATSEYIEANPVMRYFEF